MNLRTLASASALAVLFSAVAVGQANAQVFAPVIFSLTPGATIAGMGDGATLSGTAGLETAFFGDYLDPLTGVTASGPGGYSYSGSGTVIINPTLDTAIYTDGGFSFSFSPALPFVANLTTGGANGQITFPSTVPEPGSVAMLAGLAIAGSGFATRRLRRRSA